MTNTTITLFKPGVPMVWAHGFARRLGGQLVGKVINGRLRVALVKEQGNV